MLKINTILVQGREPKTDIIPFPERVSKIKLSGSNRLFVNLSKTLAAELSDGIAPCLHSRTELWEILVLNDFQHQYVKLISRLSAVSSIAPFL